MDDYTTASILAGIRAEDLRKMARSLDIPRVTRKEEVIAAIARRIETDLDSVLLRCPDGERILLAEVAFGGPVDPAAFRARHGYPAPDSPRRSRNAKLSLFHALACRDPAGRVVVSTAVAAALRQVLPEPESAAVEAADEPPRTYPAGDHGYACEDEERPVQLHEGEGLAFAELRQVLSLARSGGIAVTAKGGTPTGAAVRRIAAVLATPDFDLDAPEEERSQWYEEPGPVRAYAWGVLLQACGWCRAKGSRLELTRAGTAMLAGDPRKYKAGVERFLADDAFDELRRVNHIRGQTGKGRRDLTAVGGRRVVIADAMAEWPVGRWIRFVEVCRFQLASGNGFHVAPNGWNLYFFEKQYGSLGYAGAEGHLEKVYLRAFLFESMATLGLVDVAYVRPHGLWPEFRSWSGTDDLPFCSRYDGLLYVRLNALGAYCLDLSEAFEPPPLARPGLYKVLPNHDLVLGVAAPAAGDVATLEMFAEPQSDLVWRLSRQAILSHLERGGTAAELRQAIQGHAQNDVPENVLALLDDIARRAASIRSLEEALLIDCGDPVVAAELAADAGTAKHCQRAGEKYLVVRKKSQRAFRHAAKAAGYVLPP